MESLPCWEDPTTATTTVPEHIFLLAQEFLKAPVKVDEQLAQIQMHMTGRRYVRVRNQVGCLETLPQVSKRPGECMAAYTCTHTDHAAWSPALPTALSEEERTAMPLPSVREHRAKPKIRFTDTCHSWGLRDPYGKPDLSERAKAGTDAGGVGTGVPSHPKLNWKSSIGRYQSRDPEQMT